MAEGKEPRRFNMGQWGVQVLRPGDAVRLGHAISAIPPCGTVCCFAGEWALRHLFKQDTQRLMGSLGFSNECADALNLPSERLFYMSEWPRRLQTKLKAGTRRYAEHFVNVVLEDYIATNGWVGEE